jgi:class 3 adenylate cyclase/uncharacterized protein YggT (Ycf19 family)
MHTFKNLGLKIVSFTVGVVGIAAFTGLVVILIARYLSKAFISHDIVARPVFTSAVDRILGPEFDFLHAHLPCTIRGFDLAPIMIMAALAAVCYACDIAIHRVNIYRLTLVELRKAAESAEASRASRLAVGDAAGPMKRDEVLALYAQTKKILDSQKKNLSFLAVDVVNSTGMKAGEDTALAELDFRHYRKFVEDVIAARNFLKASWTPDGVMICFSTVQDAAQAGQDLILGLEKFNREIKTIKTDFAVRCGVNAGDVNYEDSMKMEEMADGCIDLAGHMQKYAPSGAIYVGASVIEGLPSKLGFRPANAEVDGRAVYEWRKDFARSGETAST